MRAKWEKMRGNERETENSGNDKPIQENTDMNALRARVNALRRKMARPLAVLRLYRLAYQYCIDYYAALVNRLDPPNSRAFIDRVVSAGFAAPHLHGGTQIPGEVSQPGRRARRRYPPPHPPPLVPGLSHSPGRLGAEFRVSPQRGHQGLSQPGVPHPGSRPSPGRRWGWAGWKPGEPSKMPPPVTGHGRAGGPGGP